jgi:hypothetical protein
VERFGAARGRDRAIIRNLNRVAEEEECVEHFFSFVDGHRVVLPLGMIFSRRKPAEGSHRLLSAAQPGGAFLMRAAGGRDT